MYKRKRYQWLVVTCGWWSARESDRCSWMWWGRGAVAFWVERKRKGKKVVMCRMAGGGWIFDGRRQIHRKVDALVAVWRCWREEMACGNNISIKTQPVKITSSWSETSQTCSLICSGVKKINVQIIWFNLIDDVKNPIDFF